MERSPSNNDLVNLEILEISKEGEGGNTETPSPKRAIQHLHHFFTWNNYPTNAVEILTSYFQMIAYDYVFQEECGESGTKHLQGVVSLKNRKRWTEFELPKQIHWEKVKSVPEAYEYCSRPQKRTGNCWSLKYPIPQKLKILQMEKFKPWMKSVVDDITTEADDRTILWLWSEHGGTGKSTFAKYLAYHHQAILCGKGNYSDIMNIMFKADMTRSNLVVFDLPRNSGNKISYSALESIKNGLIVNTKYETGSKLFNSPHVIVFANKEPEEGALSADRLKVINVDETIECSSPQT